MSDNCVSHTQQWFLILADFNSSSSFFYSGEHISLIKRGVECCYSQHKGVSEFFTSISLSYEGYTYGTAERELNARQIYENTTNYKKHVRCGSRVRDLCVEVVQGGVGPSEYLTV